jgi:two-component system sensor histidine kinase SenX3
MESIPLRRSTVDVGELVVSALGALKREAEKREVSLSIEAGKHEASLDPEKVGWAIATLVGNAMRYVRCGTRLHPGGSIDVSIADKDGVLRIVVKDDGPGIPKEKLARLLERGAARHAPGLGLSLVKDVVEAHGGNLSLESTTDPDAHGTTVEIALPVR